MARDCVQHVPTARAQCSVALNAGHIQHLRPPTCRSQQSMRFSDNRDNDHAFRTTNGSRGRQWRAIEVCVDEAECDDATVPCHLEAQLGVSNIAYL